jgi:hypothetical protein
MASKTANPNIERNFPSTPSLQENQLLLAAKSSQEMLKTTYKYLD